MREIHYYVAGYPDNDTGYSLVSDLKGMEKVTLVGNVFFNRFYSKMYVPRKEHFYMRMLRPFLQSSVIRNIVYSRWYTLSRISYSEKKMNCLVLINSGFCFGYNKEYLQYLKKKMGKSLFVLYQLDPTDIFYSSLYKKNVFDIFDLIYNINRDDANRYKQQYWPLICSFDTNYRAKEIINDIYFCGFGEDRSELLEKMYHASQREGVHTNFIVFYFDDKQHEGIKKIQTRMDYKENLELIAESNCLLEIMHNNYDNQTQRYAEAVMYKKKLLTNNEKIKTYPFYNQKYMRVFKSVSDIDWNWVKSRENVEYQYENNFSAKFLIEDIERKLID